jgi:predicted Na+-dependent transporter
MTHVHPAVKVALVALSGRTVHVAPGTLARIVVSSVLAPLALGMLIRRLWPALAAEANPVASAIGTLVLAVAAVLLTSTVVAAPYAAWRKRWRARMTAKTPA